MLAVLAALQAVFALGMLSQTVRGVEGGPVVDVVVRVVVNVATIGLAVALVTLLRPERHPAPVGCWSRSGSRSPSRSRGSGCS